MTLPENISQIISKIEENNHEAFVVGGCVRDSLLGKTPSDWDITTSALPQEIINIFPDKLVIPTGIQHGTVTLISENTPIEITTYRIDGSYTDNRRPDSVTFSKNLAEDLKRRDFTINAMAYSPRVGLVDLFGGQKDLEAKTIRTVGAPVNRFSEDALRIMRAIRFSVVLGFEIEPETRAALFDCRHLLSKIASERITSELNKILFSQDSAKAFSEYLPIFSQRIWGREPQNPVSTELFRPLGSQLPESLPVRLSALLFLTSGLFNTATVHLASRFFENLRYESKTTRRCKDVLENIESPICTKRIPLRKQISVLGFDLVRDILLVQNALELCEPKHFADVNALLDSIRKDGDCYSIKQLDVTGSDLIEEFQLGGKAIGDALEFLLDAVINEDCDNQKKLLLQYYKNKKMGCDL